MARITVHPNPLVPGREARVCYHAKDRGGELVTVEVDDGRKPPTTAIVPIQLDGSGDGCKEWRVPRGWDTAAFNGPDAREVARMISDGDEVDVDVDAEVASVSAGVDSAW